MGTARHAVVVLCCAVLLPAQQVVERAEMIEFGDVAQRLDADAATAGKVGATDRFAGVMRLLLQDDVAPKRRPATVSRVTKQDRLIVRGSVDNIALVKGAIAQLRLASPPRARLQCSLLVVPAASAPALGLEAGKVQAADETAFGKLVRDAVKQKGALQNLPEALADPLVPFTVEPAVKGKPAEPDTARRLRGEMVSLPDGEVALAMQLVRGTLPADRTETPPAALLNRVFRLAAGKGVMVLIVDKDEAVVLFVRCTEIVGEAAQDKAGR